MASQNPRFSFAWSSRSSGAPPPGWLDGAVAEDPLFRRRQSLWGDDPRTAAEPDDSGGGRRGGVGVGGGVLGDPIAGLLAEARRRVLGQLETLPAELASESQRAQTLHCPDLFASEPDPLSFARRQGWVRPLAAALQLALYWKVRRAGRLQYSIFASVELPLSPLLLPSFFDDLRSFRFERKS